VTGTHRLDALQDVPTMAEAGYPDFVVRDWQGLVVRAGTPREIVERLNAGLNRGLASAEVRAQLEKMGAEPATGTPRAFDELLAAEVRRWGRIVKSARIKPD
jgi:tripartite-type tricarboxylate transporter receptor subunit TctC